MNRYGLPTWRELCIAAERERDEYKARAEAAEETVRGHELMKWPDEAHRLQQQRNAAIRRAEAAEAKQVAINEALTIQRDKLRDERRKVAAVEALIEKWQAKADRPKDHLDVLTGAHATEVREALEDVTDD